MKLLAIILMLVFLTSCTHNVQRYRVITVNVNSDTSYTRLDTIRVHQEEIRKLEKQKKRWRTATVVLLVIMAVYFFPYEEL